MGLRSIAAWGRRGAPAVGALLVVAILITLWPTLFGHRIFSSGDNILLFPPFSALAPHGAQIPSNYLLTDPVQGFIPDLLATRHDLAHAVAPLWNPYAGGGHPLLASTVHAPYFPLTWLSFLLPFWSSLAWIAAAKLLLAALGTYLFCRRLDLGRAPATLAGLAYGFGLYFVVWLEHPQTYVWLCMPWMFLGADGVLSSGSWGGMAVLGAFTGLAWLGGHPESAAILMAAVGAFGAYDLLVERFAGAAPSVTPALTMRRRLLLMIGGLGLGTAAGSAATLPLLELLRESGPTNRGSPPLPLQAAYSFTFPELWGNPSKLFQGAGPVNFVERTGYVGAMPLVLAFGAIARRAPRRVWFFVVLVVTSLAIVLDTFVARGVADLPGGHVVRLTRLLITASFGLAVLAAYGLQAWLNSSPATRRRMLAIMATVAVLPELVWLVQNHTALSQLSSALGQLPTVHHNETNATVVALASVWRWILLCVVGLAVLAASWGRKLPVRGAALLIVALTAVDLVTLDHGNHGAIPRAEADPPTPAAIRYLAAHQGDQRVVAAEYSLPPNTGQRYGLRDARIGIDVPFQQRYLSLWLGLGGVSGDLEYFTLANPLAQQMANAFAVRYVLLTPGQAPPSWLHPVFNSAGGVVAENDTALPRAWIAYGWRPARDQGTALTDTVNAPAAQLERSPILEGAPPAAGGPVPGPEPATVTDQDANHVLVHVVARQTGYVVLDDSAYPGWTATVDGRAAPWLPANENFRAVRVPVGAHTVEFAFAPSSVSVGLAISVISFLLLAAAGAAGWRARRKQPPLAA